MTSCYRVVKHTKLSASVTAPDMLGTIKLELAALIEQMQAALNTARALALIRNDREGLLWVQREQAYVDRHRKGQ